MKLLCISIEFSACTFSGNGVYCISQVRALSRLGHQVLVLCGKPEVQAEPGRPEGAVGLLEVPLPVWGRLDAGCAWQEFAAGAAAPAVAQAVADFGAEAVLGVDWHSLAAYESLERALAGRGLSLAPYIFMNYRVHLRTASGEDALLLSDLERRALHRSVCTTVLSRSDAQYLSEAFPDVTPYKMLHVLLPALRADMAHLPMPADVAQHAQQQKGAPQTATAAQAAEEQPSAACSNVASAGAQGTAGSALGGQQQQQQQQQAGAALGAGGSEVARRQLPASMRAVLDPGRGRYLLTCAVRVSPEKEPHRFVDLAVALAQRGALVRAGAVPLMFGAGWGSEYGQQLRARVREELPECIVLDAFMGPEELAAIYSATLLNVHPCAYDAYGMTVVEAASQGAPSLVMEGGHVGATDLLDPFCEGAICTDLTRPAEVLAGEVEALLLDSSCTAASGGCAGRLARVGAAAARKARSWSEGANAETLVGMVRAALKSHHSDG